MKWWRLETDEHGKVLSCREVESAGTGSHYVFYVRSETRADARRSAWNAYCKVRQRERHVRLTAEGRCPYCGRGQDREAGKRCSTCLANRNGRNRERRAHARGEVVVLSTRAEAVAARASEERRVLAVQLLTEVQEQFQCSNTVGQFAQWLRDRLRRETHPAGEQKPPPRKASA